MTDDFTPCERTIRMCLEALPRQAVLNCSFDLGFKSAVAKAEIAITALLPKPDPAKALALVAEWRESSTAFSIADQYESDPLNFARWLFETGRMK